MSLYNLKKIVCIAKEILGEFTIFDDFGEILEKWNLVTN